MRWFSLVACFVALAGCAHPVVERCPGATCDEEGIRFYRPALYVEVAADGSYKVVPLPNPEEQYILRVKGWLGDAGMNPTLTDGWNLTALNASTNNDATISALMGAASGAKNLMGGAMFGVAPVKPAAGLYRLDLVRGRLVGPLSIVAAAALP